jgi:hypothetical protein
LVGGPGTGKTHIANAIEASAKDFGLTSHYQSLHWTNYSTAIEQLEYGSSSLNDHHPGLIREIQECDLLIVDDADLWFKQTPMTFLGMLCQRIERGKSNVLVMTSNAWARLVEETDDNERLFNRGASPLQKWLTKLTEVNPDLLNLGNFTFAEQLELLGVGCLNISAKKRAADDNGERRRRQSPFKLTKHMLPTASAQEKAINEVLGLYLPSQLNVVASRMTALFKKAPVWHVLYTGEKNFRYSH